ncbi:MAG TPA: TatD family hydrolase [Methylomirabilota bacterium]|jgi:TatD DNase family protein|nr:TatD family hydrolase [Methylomirabilota bacterium]
MALADASPAVLFDTHAHLHGPEFADDRLDVLARARAAGVGRLLTVGTDPEASRHAVALAAAHPGVFAAVGIHPHDAARASDAALAEIAELARAPEVVAVGEIGLDYYRNLSPREVQGRALRAQLALAREVGKPVLLHCREAHEDLLEVLRAEDVGAVGGIMHCFSGDLAVAERCLALGLLVSIAGPVTYPNAGRLQTVVRALDLERLVIETDCPYLPPQPWRGKRNEPAYLPRTAARIAELRDTSVARVARQTTRNACALLGVALPDGL